MERDANLMIKTWKTSAAWRKPCGKRTEKQINFHRSGLKLLTTFRSRMSFMLIVGWWSGSRKKKKKSLLSREKFLAKKDFLWFGVSAFVFISSSSPPRRWISLKLTARCSSILFCTHWDRLKWKLTAVTYKAFKASKAFIANREHGRWEVIISAFTASHLILTLRLWRPTFFICFASFSLYSESYTSIAKLNRYSPYFLSSKDFQWLLINLLPLWLPPSTQTFICKWELNISSRQFRAGMRAFGSCNEMSFWLSGLRNGRNSPLTSFSGSFLLFRGCNYCFSPNETKLSLPEKTTKALQLAIRPWCQQCVKLEFSLVIYCGRFSEMTKVTIQP